MQSITCFDVTASCRTHILWLHHLCSYASCYTLRLWKNHPAQLLVHVIAYHCSSLHCCLQTGAPSFRPSLFDSHCKNSGGFQGQAVVSNNFNTFSSWETPMAVWIQHCFTVYTSYKHCTLHCQHLWSSNSLNPGCEWLIRRKECSCACAMLHTRLQFLAIQAFIISASVMYMDVCKQHGGMIYVHGNI